MKTCSQKLLIVFAILAILHPMASAHAQGTAFTYQGRLNDGSIAATGVYDLRFTIYDALTGGSAVSGPVTNSATSVSNGLFTATLDFGAGIFTGVGRWLEIGVRTNSGGPAFTILAPRQPVAPAPYAVFAGNVNASGISGTISYNLLAPGAAASNLQASGQSPVPSGGMILSSNSNDSSLTGAGYVKLGTTVLGDAWEAGAVDSSLAGRIYQTAVWTGTEMIVWGGYNGSITFSNGSRYNPGSDIWTSLPATGAPSARQNHTAIWTGTEMIIWGGYDGSNYLNDGARYNPTSNIWSPVTNSGAPAVRSYHTAVWTGTEMIVWGGANSTGSLNDGGRYNPVANTWAPMTTNGAALARSFHAAVWTGNAMVVWGGFYTGPSALNSGGRYYPAINTWSNVSLLPSPRMFHTAVWTGSEMIVWGGVSGIGFGSAAYNDGARYNPVSDIWTLIATNTITAPRVLHSAVWTGSEMIIWGGSGTKIFNDGGRYNLTASTPWTALTANGAPDPRAYHSAVWTGSKMIVWGGQGDSGYLNNTFAYTPSRLLYLYQRP